MKTFLLVAGGWGGSWTWQRVAPLLQAAGARVETVTLTGLGERSHLLTQEVDLNTHVQDVVNALTWREMTNVTLVGHSYGGMVVTGAADRAAERLGALVYLDAFLPTDGQCIQDLALPERREQTAAAVEDGWKLPYIHSPAFRAEDDPEGDEIIIRLSTPHPYNAFFTKLALSGREKTIPKRTYIRALRYDPSPMALSEARCREEGGWRVETVDAHHMLPFLAPEESARLLLEAAAD